MRPTITDATQDGGLFDRVLSFSIRRRKLVLLLTAVAACFGALALRELPIDAVPDVTNHQVQINTVASELSPVDVETRITYPIESALAGMPGLEGTRSLSRNGFSQVTAVFGDDVDRHFARQQIAERLGAARSSLPAGVEPVLGPMATGLGEVCMWTVEFAHPDGRDAPRVDGAPGWQTDGSYLTPEGTVLRTPVELSSWLRTVQDWIVRPQLASVSGVATIDSIGGHVRQYHVAPDPMKLVAYGRTFADVIEALERNNVSTGAGYVEHHGEAYVVRATGRLTRIDEIESVVVGSHRGVPIHVRDVAQVAIGREARTGSASSNGEEVVVGTALMRVGANSRTVAAAVVDKLGAIGPSLPAGVRVRIVLDRTKLVDSTIATVRTNLLEGALLVVIVLLLTLWNLRAALIAAAAIPLAMLATAGGMSRLGISANLMSLGALDFGLIVDGAVIIVENCMRRLAEEQTRTGRIATLSERLRIVFAASAEVRQATMFGEAIIIVVYVPILALSGVEGRMFEPMALTVILALAAAFVLSLTFVPAAVALFVTGRVREHELPIVRLARRAYAPVLRFALRARVAVVAAAVLAFVGSLALFARLGAEFVPTLDEGDVALHAIRIPGTSLTQSTALQRDVELEIGRFPEVAFVFSKTGTADVAADPMPPNVSDTFVVLKPREAWPDPREAKADLVRRLDAAVARVPGSAYEFTQPIQMRFNELLSGVRSDLAVSVFGDDFAAMRRTAESVADRLRAIPGAADVEVEASDGLPVLIVDVDRAAIARHGLDVQDVHDVVAAAVGGRAAGQVFEGDRRFDLIVRLPDEMRRDVAALETLPVPLPSDFATDDLLPAGTDDVVPRAVGGFLPLSAVARVSTREEVNQVGRVGGKRRVVVQANVRGRDLGSFVSEARARTADVEPPPGGWITWGGQFENLVAARERLALLVPLCLASILILLYASFGSVTHALLVFTGVPLAWSGGIVALWARSIPFSISAAVGFVALSGVAVLNGLVMVTFVNQLRREGASVEDALTRGSATRLRPVLMTALVAALGFLPMALATGTGAEVQKPLATVVVGGLVTSTLLTLVVLPALYRLVPGRVVRSEDTVSES